MANNKTNEIPFKTLDMEPGIVVWYCHIPQIIRLIQCKNVYHNSRALVNEIFKKNDFTRPLFNDQEILTINGFKALKKQLEWISGRVLLKSMVQQVFLPENRPDEICVSYLEEGAPFIDSHPHFSISLSHSHQITAAACSLTPGRTIGLDIEKIGDMPSDGFMKTAFTRTEIQKMKKSAVDIFLNWTLKEAYLKYIKKGFNESLHHVEIIGKEIFHNKQKKDLAVHSLTIDDSYVISLVCTRS